MASFGGGRQGQGPSDDGGVPAKPLINGGGRIVEPPTLTPAQLEWIREMYMKTLTKPPRVNGFYQGAFPPGPGVVIPDEYEMAGAARAAKRVKHSESTGENKQNKAKTTAPAAAPKK